VQGWGAASDTGGDTVQTSEFIDELM